jgi:SAM-dependent methyltransferase
LWAGVNEKPYSPFHRHFRVLKPPLEATQDTADAIAAAIAGRARRALLLGVTPRLADIGDDTTAVDWSAAMIAGVWPGDDGRRRAVEADWRAMPFRAPQFTAVIGDGSFNTLEYPDGYRAVFRELERVLTPGARFAVRFYVTPSPCESFAGLREDALHGRIGAIDALKWRLGMAVAARDGANVARGAIKRAFDETFLDRGALMAAAGWTDDDLAAIDWYKDVPDIISFPTQQEILAAVPPRFANPRFLASGTYELAERCPILAMDFRP